MDVELSEGMIVKLTKLTETSLIVHWCTKEYGLLKTVAKGARRAKSSFSGKIDLFYKAELSWSQSRSSDLHALHEVLILDYREGMRGHYHNTLAASYFCELLSHTVEYGYSIPELYDLLHRGLAYLDQEKVSWRAVLHFEKELARLQGVIIAGMSPKVALERAYGVMPRSRDLCLNAFKI